MDKVESIRNFVKTVREVNNIINEYDNRTREYIPGHKTYKREADFLDAVGYGKRTMTEISQILGVTQGATTQLAIRLENKGFIKRVSDPEDRRQYKVNLTPLGRELNEAHLEYERNVYKIIYELLEQNSEEDIIKSTQFIQKLKSLYQYIK